MAMKFFPQIIIIACLSILPHQIQSDCGCGNPDRNGESDSPSVETCAAPSPKKAGLLKDALFIDTDEMSLIPSGDYTIGTNDPVFRADHESPTRPIKLPAFYLDKFEVSNKDFDEFVTATDYETEAEKFGDSFVFVDGLTAAQRSEFDEFRVAAAPWWYKVRAADWRHPEGDGSTLTSRWEHPVVHVSWNDAAAYCAWRKKRLPTEAEWEAGCRGGRKQKLFPWGDKERPHNKHWMNIWQGEFPNGNSVDDGFAATAPVDAFKQNAYDLYNIVGNVWEWTSDLWTPDQQGANPERVKKGGSFLCHISYCYRYRCAARQHNTQDSSAGNLGFRCARNL